MRPTTRPPVSRLRALTGATGGVALAVAALAGSAVGSPRAPAAPRASEAPRLPHGCPEAGRAEVTVPEGTTGIDGFRVFVEVARPDAATDVTVLAGGRDRTLRAFGPGVFGLLLDEPLPARRVQVALEPVLDAPAGVCVTRVELLRGGAVVATARIR